MERKEAIEIIKKNWPDSSFTMLREALETIIPELKETDDEGIRKWIRKELESKYVVDNIVNNVMADKALAWLEKQGEQNLADKVKAKFEVGDYIICRNGEDTLYQITDSIPTGYMIKGNDGIIHSVTFEQLVGCNATLCVIQNQKQWKPSDEQVMVLAKASETYCGIDKGVLYSLYNDLKKLREE